MFNLFGKKKPAPVPLTVRDTLFGDMPLSEHPNEKASTLKQEPWPSFVQARNAINKGKKDEAIQVWQQITAMPDLESRHYLQAWYFLRQQGVNPPQDKAKILCGVVLEVGMPKGLDLLAAYPGGQARYYNFSGSGVVWERPNASLDDTINAVLDAGREVVVLIGPWEKERPPAPGNGVVRMSMLTPSGQHFGQGDFPSLRADPKGGRLLATATDLMLKLTELAQKKS